MANGGQDVRFSAKTGRTYSAPLVRDDVLAYGRGDAQVVLHLARPAQGEGVRREGVEMKD